MRKVLELSAFRRLLVTAMLNELASFSGAVALALLIYRRTGSALGAAAFFLVSEFAPSLVSPLLVVRLDQRSVRLVLGLLYTLEGVVFLVLAWAVTRFAVAPLLGLALIDGILAVTARVLARAAWTSMTTTAGLMREANAIINAGFSVCFMAGPALGGAIVAIGGTRTALLVNVGVFAVSTLTVATAGGLPRARAAPAAAAGRLRAALTVARGQPLLRRLLGLQAVGSLFFTISIPVEVVFAQHSLHAGPGGYGVLLSAWGAGAIVGSAVYARWRGLPSRSLITLGTCAFGAGFLVMAVAPSLAIATAGSVLAGLGNGLQFVAVRTAVQEATPVQWMALILSLNEVSFQAVPGAGIVIGGAIAAVAGPRAALAVGAVGSLAIAIAMWVKLRLVSPEGAPGETVPGAQLRDAERDAPLTGVVHRS